MLIEHASEVFVLSLAGLHITTTSITTVYHYNGDHYDPQMVPT